MPAAVRNVIAQVAAYKLGTYGNLATGRTMLLSSGSDRYPKGSLVSLMRVAGHRDAGQTACPATRSTANCLDPDHRRGGTGRAAAARDDRCAPFGGAYYTRGLVSLLWDTTTPSGLLNRFDVYADGKLAASALNTHRRATLRLSAGQHTVTVRAIHLSGRTASFTRTVIADATAPRFTMGPSVVLRRGSLTARCRSGSAGPPRTSAGCVR